MQLLCMFQETKHEELRSEKHFFFPLFIGYIGTTAAGGKYCFNLTRLQLDTLEITRHEGGSLG